ncbi:MAG: XRE family transcriptional regulator [Mesorhizobium sp.]|nr:MAG: XRE family transcriptional regulator [Mesorhizobium sp.]
MKSFSEIESRRRAAGITRKALYETAGLHKETWRRTAAGTTAPNSSTLIKLDQALKTLTGEGGTSNG